MNKFFALLVAFMPLFLWPLVVVQDSCVVTLEHPGGGLIVGPGYLRYGAEVAVLKKEGDYSLVAFEGQEGWVDSEALLEVKSVVQDAVVGFHGAYVFSIPDTEEGPIFYLPFESPVKILEELPEQNRRWLAIELLSGEKVYIQKNTLQFEKKLLSLQEMVEFSKHFLNINYLWGGTTSWGYDCSGFVQMLYRQRGVHLPRNSSEQALDGRFNDVETAKEGDLVFFKNKTGKVVHVGMMIDEKNFIHSFTKEEAWITLSSLEDPRFINGHYYYGYFLRRIDPSCIKEGERGNIFAHEARS